jgi:hypothetical protein
MDPLGAERMPLIESDGAALADTNWARRRPRLLSCLSTDCYQEIRDTAHANQHAATVDTSTLASLLHRAPSIFALSMERITAHLSSTAIT